MLLASIPRPPVGMVRFGDGSTTPIVGGRLDRLIGVAMRKVQRPALKRRDGRWHWETRTYIRQEFTESHIVDIAGQRHHLHEYTGQVEPLHQPPIPRLCHDSMLAPAQQLCADEMLHLQSSILAGEVGSGKTRTALGAAKLMLAATDGPGIVIAPAGLVSPGADGESQWSRAAHSMGIPCIHATTHICVHLANLVHSLLLVSYEQAVTEGFLGGFAQPFAVCLMDEAHRLCSLTSRRAQRLLQFKPCYRVAMTATPFPNKPGEIYNLLDWVDAPALPARSTFTNRHTPIEVDVETGQRRAGQGITCPHTFLDVVGAKVVVLSKQDINPDIPLPRIHRTNCAMSLEQALEYNRRLSGPRSEKGRLPDARQLIGGVREACAMPFSEKLSHVVEECVERSLNGQQTIVVCARLAQSDAIQDALDLFCIPSARIDSTTSGKQGGQADAFRNRQADVLLMGSKCAEGHSFSDCDRLIIPSLDWPGQSLPQTIGRICRLDSTGRADIEILIHPGTIEEHQLARLYLKTDLAAALLHAHDFDEEQEQYLATACRPIDTANLNPESQYQYTHGTLERESAPHL